MTHLQETCLVLQSFIVFLCCLSIQGSQSRKRGVLVTQEDWLWSASISMQRSNEVGAIKVLFTYHYFREEGKVSVLSLQCNSRFAHSDS